MRRMVFLVTCLVCSYVYAAEQQISADTFKGKWPFVTNKGVLSCMPGPGGRGKVITFKTSAGVFAVNGTALSGGFADMEPMWLDNEEIPGAKVSVRDVIDFGESLCGK